MVLKIKKGQVKARKSWGNVNPGSKIIKSKRDKKPRSRKYDETYEDLRWGC